MPPLFRKFEAMRRSYAKLNDKFDEAGGDLAPGE